MFTTTYLIGIACSEERGTLPLALGLSALSSLGFSTSIIGRCSPILRNFFIVALGFQLGLLRENLNRPLPFLKTRSKAPCVVTGRVLEVNEALPPERSPLDGDLSEITGHFLLDLDTIQNQRAMGRVRVRFRGRRAPPSDARVRILGSIHPPQPPANPGQVDFRRRLRREGIVAFITLGDSHPIEMIEPPRRTFIHVRDALRHLLSCHLSPEAAALAAALTLGSRENLPRDFTENLQQTGTAHFLAISGMNIMLLFIPIWGLLVLIGIRGSLQTILLILFLWSYTALTGFQISVLRATVMLCLYLTANLLWRPCDVLQALILSALILATASPSCVFGASFQLSYAAVLGILILMPVFSSLLTHRDPPGGIMKSCERLLRTTLAVSLSAWFATAPITLTHFNLLNHVTIFANMLLLPLMTLEVVGSIGILLLHLMGLAAFPAWIVERSFEATRWISGLLAGLPASHTYGPAPPLWAIIVFYSILLWAVHRSSRWRIVPILATPLLLVVSWRRHPPEGFLVTTLDVGRGTSVYLEWPDGRNMIYDVGSLSYRDAGLSVAAPYLWSRGITRVDLLALSHPHEDHINGAHSLIERFRIRRILTTPYFERWRRGRELLDWARRRGILVTTIPQPPFERIGPPLWEAYPHRLTENDSSLALRVQEVLLSGDLQARAAATLLFEGTDLQAPILLAPHHGKMFAGHKEFAQAVSPQLVLVSAPEGYYSRLVVENFRRRGARVLTTGNSGCIEVTLTDKSIGIHEFKTGLELRLAR